MEADWEVEVGPGTPVIEALWVGLVDLRAVKGPMLAVRLAEIKEAEGLPALKEALIRLNGAALPFWTSKCDVWQLESVDPDEMEAAPPNAVVGRACYLDILPRKTTLFTSLAIAERVARAMVRDLRLQICDCCRVDVVVRQALAGEMEGYGITVYVAGCGSGPDEATAALVRVLPMVVDALLLQSELMQDL